MSTQFEMPPITLGQRAYYYEKADNNANPHVGIVTKVASRTISLRLMTQVGIGDRIHNIRHRDDPQLKENAEIRKAGAWDYTQETRDQAAINDKLTQRINELEELVLKLSDYTYSDSKKK